MKQLSMLRKTDICEVKALASPPSLVSLTFQALCIMFEVRLVRCMSAVEPGRKIDDYWTSARRCLLSDGCLIRKMLEFDKDNIPQYTIKKLAPILENDDFSPERLKIFSVFCTAICVWIRSIVTYHHLACRARPTMDCLAEREKEIDQLSYHQKVIDGLRSDLMVRVNKGATLGGKPIMAAESETLPG